MMKLTLNSGIPEYFASALTIVFIVLKLTNHINWSWWWVLSPLWIDLAIIALLIIVMIVIYIFKD